MGTARPAPVCGNMDAMTDARDPEQAWYWTEAWQAGEAEADQDIAEGRTTQHADVDAMFRSLAA